MAWVNLKKKQRREVNSVRKGKYQDIYQDKRWKKLRRLKLINNPTCERCEEKGRTKLADEVHHIIPFDKGNNKDEIDSLAFDYDNLMSLCDKCHDEIHKEIKDC
jgi:5-methylcytosine-specific restriction enzyme A